MHTGRVVHELGPPSASSGNDFPIPCTKGGPSNFAQSQFYEAVTYTHGNSLRVAAFVCFDSVAPTPRLEHSHTSLREGVIMRPSTRHHPRPLEA